MMGADFAPSVRPPCDPSVAAGVGNSDVTATREVSVLVIDDDRDIREALREILQDEGYSVDTAANGAEALELLGCVAPQLILLDLSMPVMGGQEFRQAQLGDPRYVKTPIVLMTAADQVNEKSAGMEPAASLHKPLVYDDLLAIVGRFCGPPQPK